MEEKRTTDIVHKNRFLLCLLFWVLILCMALLLNGLTDLLPREFVEASYGETKKALFSVPVWKGLLVYCFFNPLVEELIFRIGLFGMGKYFMSRGGVRPWVSVSVFLLVSSLTFAIYHGNLIQGNYAFWMGLLLCLGYDALGTPFADIPAHQLANLLIYLLSFHENTYRLITSPVFLLLYGMVAVPGIYLLIRRENLRFSDIKPANPS